MESIFALGGTNDNKKVVRWLSIWLKEAGGSISLDELRRRYIARFRCEPQFYTGDEVEKYAFEERYRLVDGMVSKFPTVH